MSTPQNIRHLSPDELKENFISFGEKAFRAKQVYEWLWKKSVTSFDEMTSLSIPLRAQLKEKFFIPGVQIHKSQISNDRTIKNAFKLKKNALP